jgi:heparosan-N-sulfate-glucuronate 5-epimerase
MPGRRGRGRRAVTLLALLLFAAVGAVGYGLARYSFRYDRNRFNPASLETPYPSCFYLDWTRDLPDLRAVRAQLGADGICVLPPLEVVQDGKSRHDPLVVIQAALGFHDRLLRGREPALDAIFRRQLDWLVNDGMVMLPDSIAVWPQYYRFDRYGLRDRWVSALTQGQAISLLVRGANYTGRREYLDLAEHAVSAFTRSGLPIVWRGADGAVFFEEYPCTPAAHVLNGALLAWLGLWDYARARDDAVVRGFCLQALESITITLPRYEIGDWTRYDVQQARPTSPHYQELHAALAETMAGIFPGDARWKTRAQRWRRAADDPWQRSRIFFLVAWNKATARLSSARQAPPQGLLLDERR